MSSTATSKHPARIGRYRITGVIGRGGMGAVYRGHDDALDRDVAVKVIHDRFGHSENVLRRFGEEAKNVARLSSPHIVHVHEFDPLAVPPFLAMELVRGPSLQQLIRGRGRASFATVVDCARQVLAHRDDMPPQLEAWLDKLLAHDPAMRFASAAAALDALRQVEIPADRADDYATLHFDVEACDADAPAAPTPRLDVETPEPIPREQVDSIIRSAMRLEAAGRSLLGDDTVLEIARELNVESRFVRRALADHRAANAPPLPPLPPPPNFAVSPAAAPLDPATRVACADAIDRLWWAILVGMGPSIPILNFPIFSLIALGMARRPAGPIADNSYAMNGCPT